MPECETLVSYNLSKFAQNDVEKTKGTSTFYRTRRWRRFVLISEDLTKWIKSELTVDVSQELAKYKDDVKDLIRLTSSGENLLVHNQRSLTAKEKISLYMIAKLYSNYAQYSKELTVTNKELEDALGLPEGTVKTSLFALRKDRSIVSVEEGVHKMKFDNIGEILSDIRAKIGEKMVDGT